MATNSNSQLIITNLISLMFMLMGGGSSGLLVEIGYQNNPRDMELPPKTIKTIKILSSVSDVLFKKSLLLLINNK